jgi:hypothetical protein
MGFIEAQARTSPGPSARTPPRTWNPRAVSCGHQSSVTPFERGVVARRRLSQKVTPP